MAALGVDGGVLCNRSMSGELQGNLTLLLSVACLQWLQARCDSQQQLPWEGCGQPPSAGSNHPSHQDPASPASGIRTHWDSGGDKGLPATQVWSQ